MSVDFITVDKVKAITIGNTLTVSGQTNNVFPPLNDDLSLISEATTAELLTPTGQTTRDWTNCGSTANLAILENSTVIYAQLIWYSTVVNNEFGSPNVVSNQNDAITFTTPAQSFTLAPTYTESFIINDTDATRLVNHLRVVDVTDYVKQGLSGDYTVEGVPTSIPTTGLSTTRAGWALHVIIKNKTFTPQYISLSTGIQAATPEGNIQYFLSGFQTPTLQKPKGFMTLVAANGEPYKYGERLRVGSSFANLSIVGNSLGIGHVNPETAPNNPYDNPFTGQINIADPLNESVGLINLSGTNATVNNNPFLPLEVVGARNKFDILCLNLEDQLQPDQTQFAFQLNSRTSTAIYEVLTKIIQVDAKGGNLATTFEVDKSFLEVDKTATYRLRIENMGDVTVSDVEIVDILEPDMTFIMDSIQVNGQVIEGEDITTGLTIGDITPDKTVTITYEVAPVDSEQTPLFLNTATIQYNFLSGQSGPYTNEFDTRVTSVEIEHGELSIDKSVDAITASLNQVLTYSLVLENTGTVSLSDVLVIDKLHPSLTFVPDSIYLNGVVQPGLTIENGLTISEIDVDMSLLIRFSATVTSIPPLGFIDTKTYTTYSYYLPHEVAMIRETEISQVSPVLVNYSEITQFISNNNNYPLVNDVVTYTITLTNTGNIEAQNVPVQVTMPEGVSFIEGTLAIDGIEQPLLNPTTGLTIDAIDACTSVILTFDGRVDDIPADEEIVNIAYIPYRYQIDPNGNIITDELESNEVVTRTNDVELTVTKNVNTAHATIGDELVYEIIIENTGNIKATNVEFLDVLHAFLTFVPGSVKVNCEAQTTFNPNDGFVIDEIGSGDRYTITFVAEVNNIPRPTLIPNTAQITYDYQPDPFRNPITETMSSNEVNTNITIAEITFVKEVDKSVAQVGDTLSYVLKAQNIGVVNLTNLYFSDPLPPSVTFVDGSVSINTISYPQLNPIIGFTLPDLFAVEEVTISFSVTVIELPVSYFVKNRGQLTYSSQLNPLVPTETNTIDSNVVQTNIISPVIEIEKFVDKNIATLEDILTYTFTVRNTGNVNVENIIFEDILQDELMFVPNSVIINDITYPGLNPNNTFTLGALDIGDVLRLSFNARIQEVPIPNIITNDANLTYDYVVERTYSGSTISNTVETIVNVGDLTIVKAVDREFATVNDIITYTATLHNIGNVTNRNVTFVDIIPTDTSFIEGSLFINGTNFVDATPDSLALADITAGSTTVVTFEVEVVSVPETERLDNTADVTYTYQIDPEEAPIVVSETSNEVTTFINIQTVAINKNVDKQYATLQDELTYTINITNNGNVDLVQTNFIDLIDIHTPFILGSVLVDNQPQTTYNPNSGFTLGTIVPNQTVTVSFRALVSTVPSLGYVENVATLDYLYTLTPDGVLIPDSVVSNETKTFIRRGLLTIEKLANREFAAINDSITYTFFIKNTGNTNLIQLQFTDVIQVDGSSFDSGSVIINNVSYPGVNPTTGFSLPDLGIGQTMTVSFIVDVTNVPATQDEAIFNTATTNFDFLVDPTDPTSTITQTVQSNQTIVYVRDTRLTLQKSVEEAVAKVNDIITYSFIVNNPGNIRTDNTQLFDLFDDHVTFTEGSVVINGVLQEAASPITGISLGSMLPNTTVTVSFTAQINSLPDDSIVYNTGRVDYDFTVDSTVTNESVTSNTVETLIVTAQLDSTKEVNKAYAEIQDTLTYTIRVTNVGTVFAQSVLLSDVLDENLSFIEQSVIINGQDEPSQTLINGITLPNLAPEETAVVSFDVQVDSLPEIPYDVFNSASINFNFIDPITSLLAPGPTSTTNTVVTNIIDETLSITKEVDKAYATIGDELTYTLLLQNGGNVLLSNLVITDIIQIDATFISGSITINDDSYPDLEIESFILPFDLNVLEETTIQFKVIVNTVPTNDYIYNAAQVSYSYYVDPAPLLPKQVQRVSNRVQTKINVADISAVKSVNKAFATIDDTLLYTIEIINDGTVSLTDLNFLDLVAQGASFVQGSVYVNGVNRPNENPNNSISLNSIPIGQATTVKFNVTIDSIPPLNPLPNKADITYTYQINPLGDDYTESTETNTVTTQINEANLTLEKAVDKEYALVGDELTYTIVAKNEGNIPLTNLLLRDVLQSELDFNVDSVMIDDVSIQNINPEDGISLPDLDVFETVTLSFKATIAELPASSFVENVATTSFAYKINPSGQTLNDTVTSNVVKTNIRELNVSLRKLVDKEFVTLNDTLLYSNVLTNTGTVPLTDIVFTDRIPEYTTFIPGSVYIGSQLTPDLDVANDILLGTLNPGETRTVSFSVRVTQLPPAPDYVVNNTSVIEYRYQIDPTLPDELIETIDSNEAMTRVNVEELNITKAVNRDYARVFDLISYTITLENTGNVNLTDVLFSDELQNELSFISGTVTIDGIQRSSLNPEDGFALPTLLPGDEISITFDSRLVSLPPTFKVDNTSNVQYKYQINPNGSTITKSKISNLVTTHVVNPVLVSTKAVSDDYATLNDTLTYTITLNNTGNTDLENVIFRDTPSVGVEFIEGSVRINQIVAPSENPSDGIELGILTKNTITTITFDVLVTTVPASGIVTNKAFIEYDYVVDPTQAPIEESNQTNLVTTVINVVNTEVIKAVDKQFATPGDLLNYTVTVTNKGNIPNTNVRFVDPTPANTTFVLGSVIVNGVSEETFNPEAGFNLGTLQPEQVVTIEYQVTVTN